MQKYHINLTEEERKIIIYFEQKEYFLECKTRARILIDLGESSGKCLYTTKQISKRHGVSEATISVVCNIIRTTE